MTFADLGIIGGNLMQGGSGSFLSDRNTLMPPVERQAIFSGNPYLPGSVQQTMDDSGVPLVSGDQQLDLNAAIRPWRVVQRLPG